jgi:hypothetical protein
MTKRVKKEDRKVIKGTRPTNEVALQRADYAFQRKIQGASNAQIAREIGISPSRVGAILQEHSARWLQERPEIIAHLKVLQTQQTQHIYSQAMQSWNLSAEIDEQGNPTKEGNPVYLNTALKAAEKMGDIWGTTQPLTIKAENIVAIQQNTQEQVSQPDTMAEIISVMKQVGLIEHDMDMETLKDDLTDIYEGEYTEENE